MQQQQQNSKIRTGIMCFLLLLVHSVHGYSLLPMHWHRMQFNNNNKQETVEGICGLENVSGASIDNAEILIISDRPSRRYLKGFLAICHHGFQNKRLH